MLKKKWPMIKVKILSFYNRIKGFILKRKAKKYSEQVVKNMKSELNISNLFTRINDPDPSNIKSIDDS